PAVILTQARSMFPQSIPLSYTPTLTGASRLFNAANPFFSNVSVFEPGTLNVLSKALNIDPILFSAFWLDGLEPTLNAVKPIAGLKNPRASHFALTIEHELSNKYLVSGAYVRTKGSSLLRMTSPDVFGRGLPTIFVQSPDERCLSCRSDQRPRLD